MRLSTILLAGLFPLTLLGQTEKPKWDVNNPTGPTREFTFSLQEGTWMNLDLSPDGKTLVFDLLGDIYSMPATGGKATVLRQGLAFEVQPRFSPDGAHILFTSDAGGGDNIWIMKPDGSDARQVTREDFRLLNNASWLPDGQYFVARKHFTSQRSLGAGEIWMYHRSGGSGVQLTKRKNDQQDVNEPSVSPDGRYVYFSEDVYGGGYFQYNKDPNNQIYVIRRYDLQEGKLENVTGGPGGAVRPQISHDGKYLAFVRRVREQSVLYLHNLQTGEEHPLFDQLSKDQQEAWAIFGVYTGYAWSPDDRYIFIWAQGKIQRVEVATGKSEIIPFVVEARHKMVETLDFKNQVFSDSFLVRVIRQAVTSPDEKWLVFNAAGYLWKKSLPDGQPQRLTRGTELEFEPAFSADGRWLVYVSWDDENMGAIQKMNWQTGQITTLTNEKGIFRAPVFSADGAKIAYFKEDGNTHQGFTHSKNPGIYYVSADGGQAVWVTADGEYPVFNADGKRIYYQTGGVLFGAINKGLWSVELDGSDPRQVLDIPYAQRFSISPDNRWVAWSELYKVFIAPLNPSGQNLSFSSNSKALPVVQVAKDAGINIHWSADSKKLFWTLGDTYFSDELTERFAFLDGALDSLPPLDTTGLSIGLALPSDKPSGRIALINARIITMEGDEVIENGVIVVHENRIEKVGRTGRVTVPKDAKVYDLKGKTIMPGMIDVHGHLGNFRFGISPQKQWEYYANLAYGVTTAHDPSSNTEMIFSQSEMIRSGAMLGPRLYSTGTILYGADGDFKAVINSLDDARSALRRTQAFGAFSVKSYNQPRREQRQWVIEAARELGMLVVPEGGSFFYHNLSMVADGHTGVEHNLPVAPLYDDVIQFWKNSRAHNTPTLIVNYGGVNGEYYFYQNSLVWEKKPLLNFVPRPVVDSRSRHRTMIPDAEYENGHILVARSCKKLQDAGININLGAHGQLQGLGAHWELWMFAQGGMTPMQALRAATLNGALYLGMEDEIGSIREGKLADLIVLDKNPLENIRNTEFIRYTMLNGRLYESSTLNEIGNHPHTRTKFYFEMPGNGDQFPSLQHNHSGCMCRE